MSRRSFGSLFAGVGGFDLGFEAAGWDCRFQVEWDKECQAVLQRHWPHVPKWGDVSHVSACRCRPVQPNADRTDTRVTQDSTGTWSTGCACGGLPPVDCITFGSPCQDLSVAGKRAGLDGARSGLFFEAIRIIKEMRDASGRTYPRVAVWENVGGALSSNGGADFGAVLDALAECGAMVIEWAVLDARWFGVPQRRRRVFVVALFDPSAAERGGRPILPVAPRSGWNPPTRPAPRPQPATTTRAGTDSSSRSLAICDVVGTLSPGAHPGGVNGQDAYTGQLVPVTHTHTHTPAHSPEGSVVEAQTSRTQQQAGWSGSCQESDMAAPLLASKGGLKTTDIDGATWVVTP